MDPIEMQDQDSPQVDYEREARNMGWVPEDQFRGNKDQWVDAQEFVERGKHVMPLLLANNKRLQRDLLTRDEKIGNLETKLASATAAIEKLEKHYTEANKRAVDNAKRQLREELKQAREDNDVDRELEIQDKLDDIRNSEKVAEQPVSQKAPTKTPELSNEFMGWHRDNPWFGTDAKKTKLVTRIAEDLRDSGTDLTGRAFMDEAVRLYEDQHGSDEGGDEESRAVSKVEGTPSRGSNKGGSGRSFATLPREAKEACWQDADELVGDGKRYKTMKEWETAYAKIYYSE